MKTEEKITENDLEKTGGLQRQPSKYERRRNFVKEYLIDYSANSNLHGLKYIGERERTFVEKVFWLFMFIFCVVLCAGLIKNIWNKWNDTPVIVSFAENTTPIWQIPFPAVTICSETKAMQKKFNYTEFYHLYYTNTTYVELTEEERNLFEDVSMVCSGFLAPSTGRKFSSGPDTFRNIRKVSPNSTDLFFGCKWKDYSMDCSEFFTPILTEEGLCYTFNTLGADDLFRIDNLHKEYPYLKRHHYKGSWTLESGYGKSDPLETYPHRGSIVKGNGMLSALTFILKTSRDNIDYLCRGPIQGFKILLHNPAEIPRFSQKNFHILLSHEVKLAIKLTMMTTTEGLRSYDALRRQCFFPNERYLRFFKVYTQANCELECLSNFTNVRCGCVHFGMPRGPNTNVCNSGSMWCLIKSQTELARIEFQSSLGRTVDDFESDIPKEAEEVGSRCQCLPSCISIEYDAEMSQADYDVETIFRTFKINFTGENLDTLYSRVMIFFKENQFITSRRSELYGLTDFLANCGGLLGLFMGFSILSVAEIIYFLTLRLYYKYQRRKNQKKRQTSEKDGIISSLPAKIKEV